MSLLETRVLALLDQGPQTARELARQIGIQPNSIWNILKPLRDQGQIQIQYIKLRGAGSGSGRGVAIYERTDKKSSERGEMSDR